MEEKGDGHNAVSDEKLKPLKPVRLAIFDDEIGDQDCQGDGHQFKGTEDQT